MPAPINISGFEVQDKIDERAGFAAYRGRQVSLDRSVRILVLPEEVPADVQRKFVEVHRRIAQINHPNIIRVIEAAERDGKAYSVIEEPDSPPISKEVDEEGPPDWPDALVLATQLTAAVAELHKERIVHGDLAPNAVYIAPDGRIRIMFTGVASAAAGPYVAPERASAGSRAPSIAADVFSLGAVLYFLLTGRPPVPSGGAITNPRDLAYMPEDFEKMLAAMLSANPPERPADARKVLSILKTLAQGEPIGLAPPAHDPFAEAEAPITKPRVPGKGQPLWFYMLAGAVAAIAVVTAATLLALRHRPTLPVPDALPTAVETPEKPGGLPDTGKSMVRQQGIDKPREEGVEETPLPGAIPDKPPQTPDTLVSQSTSIEKAFEEAEGYAQANPSDLDGIISRFETVSRMSQDEKWAERCGTRMQFYKARLAEAQAEQLDKDIAAAKALAAEGRTAEAVALLAKYDEASLEPRQMAALKDALDLIGEPLRQRAAALEKEISDALGASNIDKARAALIRLKALDLPDVRMKAPTWEEKIREQEQRVAAEEEQARQAALAALDREEKVHAIRKAALASLAKMEEDLARLAREFDFSRASRLVSDALNDAVDMRPACEAYAIAAKRLEGRMSAMKKRLEAAVADGSRVTLRKGAITLTGKVVSVSEKSVVLMLTSGTAMEVFFKDIDLADFYRYSGMDTGVQDGLLDQAAMHLLRGERDKALGILQGNVWKDDLQPLAARLSERAGKTLEREVEAAGILREARRAYYRKDADALKPLLDRLRNEFSETRVYQENLETRARSEK